MPSTTTATTTVTTTATGSTSPCPPPSSRFSTIRQLFIRSRLPRLHAIWEELQVGGDITAWLPAFYSRVLATLQQERDWVAGVLAPYTTQLLLGLANEVFGKVGGAAGGACDAPGGRGPLRLQHDRRLCCCSTWCRASPACACDHA